MCVCARGFLYVSMWVGRWVGVDVNKWVEVGGCKYVFV